MTQSSMKTQSTWFEQNPELGSDNQTSNIGSNNVDSRSITCTSRRIYTDPIGIEEIQTSLKADRVLPIGLGLRQLHGARELWSYEEAITALDVETWQKSMLSEMDSIRQNNMSWELVELPVGRKPCKWLHGYKYVSGYDRPKYKAWLIAKELK